MSLAYECYVSWIDIALVEAALTSGMWHWSSDGPMVISGQNWPIVRLMYAFWVRCFHAIWCMLYESFCEILGPSGARMDRIRTVDACRGNARTQFIRPNFRQHPHVWLVSVSSRTNQHCTFQICHACVYQISDVQ